MYEGLLIPFGRLRYGGRFAHASARHDYARKTMKGDFISSGAAFGVMTLLTGETR